MDAFDENIFIEFYKEIEEIESKVNGFKKQVIDISSLTGDLKDIGKICNMITRVTGLTDIVASIQSLLPRLNEIMSYCAEYVQYYLSQIIMKYVELIGLEIKKIVLYIKKTVAKTSKSVAEAVANGKGPAIAASVAAGAMSAMQAMAQVLNVVMQAVQMILNMFTGPLLVPAEGMCFFMTPKTIITGQMKSDITIANTNASVTDYLPEPVKLTLENIAESVDTANVPLKVSFIAAGAVTGAALAVSGGKMEISPCVDLNKVNLKSILNAVEVILLASIYPQPLPKYERLLPVNVGYMLFLMTGFNAAGKLAFGMPGFP